MKVLLYNTRLRFFPGKLKSRWDGPYEVIQAFPYGTVELEHSITRQRFKVNGARVKPYIEEISIKRTLENQHFVDAHDVSPKGDGMDQHGATPP